MIFPQLDHTATEQAIYNYRDLINGKIKATNPDQYRRLCIKRHVIDTMLKLKDMYSCYLKEARKQQTYDRVFWVAQKGVALAFGVNRSTIMRHIDRLEEAGFIERTFHGNNNGIRVRFNPSLIVAQASPEYTLMCVNNLETTGEILPERPPFSLFFPSSVAKCDHNVSCNSLFKLNMEKGSLLISEPGPQKGLSPEIPNGELDIHRKHTDIDTPASEASIPETAPRCAAPPKVPETPQYTGPDANLVQFFVERALHTILCTLYQGRWFSINKLNIAKKWLTLYFTAHANSNKAGLMEQLVQRVILTHYFIQASPERFMPDVDKWIDPHFEYGFAGTRRWYEDSKQKQKKNAEYNGNKKLLSKLIKQYYQTPDITTYQAGTKILSRKHDKQLMDIYDRCIINPTEFNQTTFNQYQNTA